MGGKPCIRGMRMTIYDVLDYLASGMTEDEILHDFPDITRDDIHASLAVATNRKRRLASPSAGSSIAGEFFRILRWTNRLLGTVEGLTENP